MQISVVIPLYNKKEQICRALNSVFNQTFQPLEIIVVNDGSTDGSEKLVEGLNHPLVNLVYQTNAGVSAARNKGIELSNGEWIAFLDADDEWMPVFLENIYSLHNFYPNANVLASSYLLQSHLNTITPIKLNKIKFDGKCGIMCNYFEVASNSHPPLWTSAIVVKKEALVSINGFPNNITSGEDLLTWAKLAVRNEIAYSIEPLSIFNMDNSHIITEKPSRLHDSEDFVGNELIKLLKTSKDKSIKLYVSHWYKMRASVFLRLNKKSATIKYSLKAIIYNPQNIKCYLFMIMVLMPESIQVRIKNKYIQ